MQEKRKTENRYPIGCLISELNRCYGCFINYVLDNMDDEYQVSDSVIKKAIDDYFQNVEFGLEQIINVSSTDNCVESNEIFKKKD